MTVNGWLNRYEEAGTERFKILSGRGRKPILGMTDLDKVKEEQRGLTLFYLPPYSPHLGLAKVLWRKLEYKWLRP